MTNVSDSDRYKDISVHELIRKKIRKKIYKNVNDLLLHNVEV